MTASTHPLPALRTKPKAIFFTDFDGTITLHDSNDWMTDNLGFGVELRRQGNKDVLHNGRPFRDAFQEMLDSVTTPFDRCIELLLENVKLDPAFKEFATWVCPNIFMGFLTFLAPITALSILLFHEEISHRLLFISLLWLQEEWDLGVFISAADGRI